MQEAIADKFHVNPQRLEIKSCTNLSDTKQVLPLEILGVPNKISSMDLARNISALLNENGTALGKQFSVDSAETHQDKVAQAAAGVSTGTIAALVLSVAALVGTVAVCYFKSEEIGAMLRRARRVIKSKVSGTQLDVDEDGSTMYGDGHTGAMRKANSEITYELEGAGNMEDAKPNPIVTIPESQSTHSNF